MCLKPCALLLANQEHFPWCFCLHLWLRKSSLALLIIFIFCSISYRGAAVVGYHGDGSSALAANALAADSHARSRDWQVQVLHHSKQHHKEALTIIGHLVCSSEPLLVVANTPVRIVSGSHMHGHSIDTVNRWSRVPLKALLAEQRVSSCFLFNRLIP